MVMTDCRHFSDAIRSNLGDPTPRRDFADWLEERGDSRGACVRLLSQLGPNIGPLALYRPALWQSLLREPAPDWLVTVLETLVKRIDDELGDGRKTAVL